VVHTNTGFEDRVKSYIEDRAKMEGVEDLVVEVLVPTETIVEPVKGGKKKTSVRKFFPGYILIKMELNDNSWHFIRNIPKVIGFVGGKLKDGRIDPDSVPDIAEPEVLKIKQQIEEVRGKVKDITKDIERSYLITEHKKGHDESYPIGNLLDRIFKLFV